MRGEKVGETTRHIKFPPDLEDKLKRLAEFHNRPFTEMVVHLLDERVNGPRELRLMAQAGGKK